MALPAVLAATGGGALPWIGLGLGAVNLLAGLGQKESQGFHFRQVGRDLEEQYGPKQIARQTLQLYGLLSKSPAFRERLTRGARGVSAARLAAGRAGSISGLNTTGLGAIQAGVGASLGADDVNQAQGDLFQMAVNAAMQNIQSRMAANAGSVPQYGMEDLFKRNVLSNISAGFGNFLLQR
jgi:hypothetical protein